MQTLSTPSWWIVYNSVLSASARFFISKYQTFFCVWTRCYIFPILLRASLNSSTGTLCVSVLLRSLSIRFLLSRLLCLLCCMNWPNKNSKTLLCIGLSPCPIMFFIFHLAPLCFLSRGLFWCDHSLPSVGTLARTVSALFEHWALHRSFSIWLLLPLMPSA